MSNLFEKMKEYQVTDVNTIEEFCNRYYKYNSFKGRGKEHMEYVIKSDYEEIKRFGYCMITHHDSITGEIVTFYPKEIN
jgi:phage terminase small subunit